MWLSTPHDDQCQHSAAVEDPRSERKEVDQRVDCPIQHHGHRYQRLKGKDLIS